MVRISIEVHSGAVHFRVVIQASSVRRAASLIQGLYSTRDVSVIFLIDPEDFFVEDAFAKEVLIERSKIEAGELAA